MFPIRTSKPVHKRIGRRVLCSHCGKRTVLGKVGTFHKVMFIFCETCIAKDLPGCFRQMRDSAGIKKEIPEEAA